MRSKAIIVISVLIAVITFITFALGSMMYYNNLKTTRQNIIGVELADFIYNTNYSMLFGKQIDTFYGMDEQLPNRRTMTRYSICISFPMRTRSCFRQRNRRPKVLSVLSARAKTRSAAAACTSCIRLMTACVFWSGPTQTASTPHCCSKFTPCRGERRSA